MKLEHFNKTQLPHTAKLMGKWLLAALIGFVLGNFALLQQQQQLQQQLAFTSQQLLQEQAKGAELSKNVDFLLAELAVEKNTNQLLQQDAKEDQNKVFELRKELAIIQKIVSPKPQAGSLAMDSFSLQPGSAVGSYKFSMLLIEQDKQKKQVKGQIEIQLLGIKKGKKTKVDLLTLAGFQKNDRKFTLSHFKIFEGEFVLPAGFEPSNIELKLSTTASRNQPAKQLSRQLAWATTGEILE